MNCQTSFLLILLALWHCLPGTYCNCALGGSTVITMDEWFVTGVEIWENREIHLKGSLEIKEGGSLTLKNVTLKSGWPGICVEAGGSLFVHDSHLTALDPEEMFLFGVSGANFTMKNSRLTRCDGLYLCSDAQNVEMDNNIIENNRAAIEMYCSGSVITSNIIRSNKGYGIYMNGSVGCAISYNDIQADLHGFPVYLFKSHGNTFVGNQVVQTHIPGGTTLVSSNSNTFESNHLSGIGLGITMWNRCDGNVLRNNNISTNEAGIMVWGWNNRVEGNVISNSSQNILTGIYMVNAYNSYVSGNQLSGVGDENGIFMRRSIP